VPDDFANASIQWLRCIYDEVGHAERPDDARPGEHDGELCAGARLGGESRARGEAVFLLDLVRTAAFDDVVGDAGFLRQRTGGLDDAGPEGRAIEDNAKALVEH